MKRSRLQKCGPGSAGSYSANRFSSKRCYLSAWAEYEHLFLIFHAYPKVGPRAHSLLWECGVATDQAVNSHWPVRWPYQTAQRGWQNWNPGPLFLTSIPHESLKICGNSTAKPWSLKLQVKAWVCELSYTSPTQNRTRVSVGPKPQAGAWLQPEALGLDDPKPNP